MPLDHADKGVHYHFAVKAGEGWRATCGKQSGGQAIADRPNGYRDVAYYAKTEKRTDDINLASQ